LKINFNKPLLLLDGSAPLKKPGSEDPFLLRHAAIEALLAHEENIKGEDKVRRFRMATKIQEGANPGDVEFNIEEIALLKQVIGKGYGPLIVGQAWDYLEGTA
jgi:hypothetical protein